MRVPAGNGSVNLGIDYMNLAGDLTNDRYMDPLVKSGILPVRFSRLRPKLAIAVWKPA